MKNAKTAKVVIVKIKGIEQIPLPENENNHYTKIIHFQVYGADFDIERNDFVKVFFFYKKDFFAKMPVIERIKQKNNYLIGYLKKPKNTELPKLYIPIFDFEIDTRPYVGWPSNCFVLDANEDPREALLRIQKLFYSSN